VAESRLHWWSPGNPVCERGKRLLIGVATYSEYDMRLLDLLDDALGESRCSSIHVDVFDVLDCPTMDDFDRYVPGVGIVLQTPVVGVWENGVLKDKGSGAPAREKLVVEPFHLDWVGQRWCWQGTTP